MRKITGEISGNGGAFQWLGQLQLNETDGNVSGTIMWTCSQGYDGTETVEGTLVGSALKFKGVGEVANRGRFKLVNCSYSGTLEDDRIQVNWEGPRWVAHGEASGKVIIES